MVKYLDKDSKGSVWQSGNEKTLKVYPSFNKHLLWNTSKRSLKTNTWFGENELDQYHHRVLTYCWQRYSWLINGAEVIKITKQTNKTSHLAHISRNIDIGLFQVGMLNWNDLSRHFGWTLGALVHCDVTLWCEYYLVMLVIEVKRLWK